MTPSFAFTRWLAVLLVAGGLSACGKGDLAREVDSLRGSVTELTQAKQAQRARVEILERELTVARRDMGMLRGEVETLSAELAAMEAEAAEAAAEAEASRAVLSGDEPAYGAHLASYRSREGAVSGWRELSARHAGLLEGMQPVLSVLDMGEFGGEFLRLKVGPVADEAAAEALCAEFTTAGEYCVITDYSGELLE